MKLNTRTLKSSKKGMTLLELTVVILVLLSLISILFIGARAWKKGSDRAGCILNIRNFQQAIRSYGNMQGLNPGQAIPAGATRADVVVGAGLYMERAPVCPGGGTYTGQAGTTIPPVLAAGGAAGSNVALTCDFSDGPAHTPANTADW